MVKRFRDAAGRSTPLARLGFSEGERAAWRGDPAAAALCFTAKEAISKAIGTGLRLGQERGPGVPCRDLEVLVDLGARRAAVQLSGEAAARAAELGADRGVLICRADGDTAAALAVLLRRGASASDVGSALSEALARLEQPAGARAGR